jgi:hypothetical protein
MQGWRTGRRAVLSFVTLCFGAWLALFAASCVYTPRQRMTPSGEVSHTANFAGTYCFASEAASMRRYSASDPATIPFFSTYQLPEQTTVHVTHDATSVSMTFLGSDGTEQRQRYDFAAQGGHFDDGVLVVKPFQASSPFGWYRTRRKSTMYKLVDESLVMTDQHTATGLACALIPTHERSESVLTLRPGPCAPRS